MKNEKQLQAKMVMEFSQKYPEKNGQLFSVRNTTFSAKDGATQKAIGMKAGVSDLIYLDNNGLMVGIEVKFPKSKHNRTHILKQYVWGETVEKCGGEYFIVNSLEGFLSIIEGKELSNEVYTLDKIREKLNNSKSELSF